MGAKICRQLGLNHESPELFFSPQYKMPMILFAVLRVALFFYAFTIITIEFISKIDGAPWVYLTNWTYIVLVLTLFVKAVIVIDRGFLYGWKRYDQPNKFGKRETMCWYLKLEWVLHNVTVCAPYMVTFGFWQLMFSSPYADPRLSNPMYFNMTVQMHGVNVILAFFDLFIGATPNRLIHLYIPILYCTVYYSFSGLMYVYSNHGPIYPRLNWDHPGEALIFTATSYGETIVAFLISWSVKKLQQMSRCGCVVQPTVRQHQHVIADSTTPLLVSDTYDDVL